MNITIISSNPKFEPIIIKVEKNKWGGDLIHKECYYDFKRIYHLETDRDKILSILTNYAVSTKKRLPKDIESIIKYNGGILYTMYTESIHRKVCCIGDSHISVFSGVDKMIPIYHEEKNDNPPCPKTSHNTLEYGYTVCYRIGEPLAYKFSKWMPTVLKIIQQEQRTQSHHIDNLNLVVLLSFGEIDCRVHLVKRSVGLGVPLEEEVAKCVQVYFDGILSLRKQISNRIIVYGPPTSPTIGGQYPSYGSKEQLNTTTILFNKLLKEKCLNERNISFLSVVDILIDDNLKVNGKYYMNDGIHLSQVIWPILGERLNNLL